MAPRLTDQEQAVLNKVRDCFKDSETDLKPWRALSDQRYRLYRGVRSYREAMRRATPPDRDLVMREALKEWGADLDIPIAYSTVETILPRAVANRPRGLVMPEEREAEENVQNMKLLVDSQQERMGYELTNQATAKSGFIFGLGIQKETWRTKVRKQVPYLRPAIEGGGSAQATRDVTLYDGPWIEDVDIYDFFWHPMSYMDGLELVLPWALHRTWRDDDYVIDKLRSGAWNSQAALQLVPDDVKAMVGAEANTYNDVFRDRMIASGFTDFGQNKQKAKVHEVWEYEDDRSGQVVTILDRQVPVRIANFPYWHGQMPYMAYRPTDPGMKRLAGIGEIEPIAELIREMNTLRSQRRDNATLKLQQVFAFDPDAVHRDHLKFGPGIGIPVSGTGSVRDFLMPINVGDIPFSSYREEQQISADIDRTSGISDAIAGGEGTSGGAASTATGAQLLTAAASLRIELKSRRLELETVTRATIQQISLNQQMISTRRDVRVPRMPEPGETDPRLWEFIQMGPQELAGQMSFIVEGGAMAPKNPAQEANQGMTLWNGLRDNPRVDQGMLVKHFLEANGVKQAQAWILPPEPQVPAAALDALRRRFGPDVDQILQFALSQNGAQQNGVQGG